jgi:hypothetical protein
MNYSIKEENDQVKVSINIEGIDKKSLIDKFNDCKTGSCGCPTDEYKNVQDCIIDEADQKINLTIIPKENIKININEIKKCLDYTGGDKDEIC